MSHCSERPRKVLLTRSHAGNLELAAKLQRLGFEPVCADILDVVPTNLPATDNRLKALGTYDWLLLTSPVGAEVFAERVAAIGISPKNVRTRIAVTGTKTAETLSRRGWKADFIPSRFLASTLAQELPPGRRVLLMHSDIAGVETAKVLRRRGFEVDEALLYQTRTLNLEDTGKIEDSDMVIFGSPSAVEGLCSQLPVSLLSVLIKKQAACIGPVTASVARARGFVRIIQPSEEQSFDSLLEEIERTYAVA